MFKNALKFPNFLPKTAQICVRVAHNIQE
jgi:hypothetical protein